MSDTHKPFRELVKPNRRAIAFADESPFPDESQLLTGVFTEAR